MGDVDGDTLVTVVELHGGRRISWGDGLTERLGHRVDDVRRAVVDGVQAVSSSLADLATVDGWRPAEVSASFGITLTAESGVVLTKASAEATFEVTVVFRRAE